MAVAATTAGSTDPARRELGYRPLIDRDAGLAVPAADHQRESFQAMLPPDKRIRARVVEIPGGPEKRAFLRFR